MTEPHIMSISQSAQTQTSAAGERQRLEADALDAALRDMAASFSSDFAGGLVGQRHNTFGHRTRILRQMTLHLAAMRARDALPIV
jgi:hypothetical protein